MVGGGEMISFHTHRQKMSSITEKERWKVNFRRRKILLEKDALESPPGWCCPVRTFDLGGGGGGGAEGGGEGGVPYHLSYVPHLCSRDANAQTMPTKIYGKREVAPPPKKKVSIKNSGGDSTYISFLVNGQRFFCSIGITVVAEKQRQQMRFVAQMDWQKKKKKIKPAQSSPLHPSSLQKEERMKIIHSIPAQKNTHQKRME